MNVGASIIKIGVLATGLAVGLLTQVPVFAADSEAEAMARERAERAEELRLDRKELMAAMEEKRAEAERAAEEAHQRAAELRAEAEQLRREAHRTMREAGEHRSEHMREVERLRNELSHTHRELREASREVARAHRELVLVDDRRIRTRMINLGDRAMLGVILGEETDEGIKVVGVSPDGPAERAGLKTGDVIVSLRGKNLAAERDSGSERSPREVIFDVMSEVKEGEEISVGVMREGKPRDFMVKPEKREPASWASMIRLPQPPEAPGAPGAPAHPLPPEAVLAIPPVDTARLAQQAAAMVAEFDAMRAVFEGSDYDFEFDAEALSELSSDALSHAAVIFGPPAAMGIRFAELNEDLGSYFSTDRGVLVLDAPEDNPLALKSGDVVLKVGDSDVDAVSDIFRALRNFNSGDEVRLAIKRTKRNKSITVTMPENRFGFSFLGRHINDS